MVWRHRCRGEGLAEENKGGRREVIGHFRRSALVHLSTSDHFSSSERFRMAAILPGLVPTPSEPVNRG